jgi:hypothetical protein
LRAPESHRAAKLAGAAEARIEEATLPYTDVIRRLCTIPGVDLTAARLMIAEFGVIFGVEINTDQSGTIPYSGPAGR